MKKPPSNLLFFFLIVLIATGTTIAITGIYSLDDLPNDAKSFKAVHDFDRQEISIQESKRTLFRGSIAYYIQDTENESAKPTSEKGMSIGEIMRRAGILAVFTAIIILLLIEFVYRDRINRMNYCMLLIISLFVLPVIVGPVTSTTVLETTKTVESCGSCHVMDPFVNDLQNPESTSLAARHFKNKWIP
ncbi:MAG: hypothetical protein GVY08_14200 [Bacteroidetes bacterium]|jgi:hypothetical protein|nr:hypothetical protein [Bacteroidota bacterium]